MTIPPVASSALLFLLLLSSAAACAWMRRRRTKRRLEKHLPTVVWTPRFVDYDPREEDGDDDDGDDARRPKKMASSDITNILPKMERLGGPYGMYATVYGASVQVVHVGHPLPARAILAGAGVGSHGARGSDGGAAEGAGRSPRAVRGPLRWLPISTSKRRGPSDRRSERGSFADGTASSKSPAYDHFLNFSGKGVFTADGSDWKSKRSSVLHCLLGNGTLGRLEGEANRSADGLLRDLKASRRGEAADVVPALQRATVGLIYRLITRDDVSFGRREGAAANDDDGASEASSRAEGPPPRSSAAPPAPAGSSSPTRGGASSAPSGARGRPAARAPDPVLSLLPDYLRSVTEIRMIVLAQSRSVWYLLPRWAYRLFSPMYRREEKAMGPIRQFARLACLNARRGSPLEMLSKRSSHSNEEGGGISKDLLDEAITLLFAGQDTSAATLSWTLHLLSLDPKRQRRLAEEVGSALGNDGGESRGNGDFVSKAMIGQMPYLDAVIKESMRLYPVAPFVVRRLTGDIVIPDEASDRRDGSQNSAAAAAETNAATTTIPSSAFACIWIYALHRNPKLWHSPDEFLPERWIDPQLRRRDLGQDEPGAYVPFALGPRNCLGRPLAQVALRIMLARIVRRYEVVDSRYEALKGRAESGGEEVDGKCLRKDMQAGFTVLPSNGLRLRFVERGLKDG